MSRANHTGTQAAATISDFDAEVSNNTSVTANTAKVSADGLVTTHSDVTSAGSGAIITTVERSKLGAIEANATADQTGAEIKTAYEAETKAFTDAQFDKLAAIEDNADVTDATNVAAAGAVMNTGNETIAGTKTFSSTIYGNLSGNVTGQVSAQRQTALQRNCTSERTPHVVQRLRQRGDMSPRVHSRNACASIAAERRKPHHDEKRGKAT